MKSIKLFLMAIVAILTISVSAQTKETAKKAESTKCGCTKCGCAKGKCDCTANTCKCSSCSKETKDSKDSKVVAKKYVCPMHADITSDKPAKCSKCGMDLKPAKS